MVSWILKVWHWGKKKLQKHYLMFHCIWQIVLLSITIYTTDTIHCTVHTECCGFNNRLQKFMLLQICPGHLICHIVYICTFISLMNLFLSLITNYITEVIYLKCITLQTSFQALTSYNTSYLVLHCYGGGISYLDIQVDWTPSYWKCIYSNKMI